MKINTEKMCANELRKAGLLLAKAAELSIPLDGYCGISVNESSGNVFLWCDDCDYTLFIGPCSDEIRACWTDPENGDKKDAKVGDATMEDLDAWVGRLRMAASSGDEPNDE